MANGGNRPIAPVRKLIAAVLGTVATFVVLFGLGMTSWAIVALGVALLVLAIALATVRGGGRTWVVGVGHVHSASEPPTQYAFGRCELQLVIDAPGLPPRSKKIIEPRVPVAKWPSLGQTLPIRVALDDQRHVQVLWDEVPTHAETAAAVADLPPEFAGAEPMDEVLIQQDAPPWADRAPTTTSATRSGDPFRTRSATRSATRGDRCATRSGARPAARRRPRAPLPEEREPVVMHQSPGGPVVLEGVVVEPHAGGLPRRATPAPRPPAEERFDEPAADRFDTSDEGGSHRPSPDDPADRAPSAQRAEQPSASASSRPPAQRSGPGAADPLDPLDFRWTTPPRRGRTRDVTDEELDQAIFGFDAGSARRRSAGWASPCWSPTCPGRWTSTVTCSASARSTRAPTTPSSPPGDPARPARGDRGGARSAAGWCTSTLR